MIHDLDKSEELMDSSDFLSDEDYKNLEDIVTIKKKILSYINKSVLVDEIIRIIDNSKFINFKHERARRLIDRERPVFYIVVDKDESLHSNEYAPDTGRYKNGKFLSLDKEIDFISDIVFNELISKTNTFIMAIIKEDKNLNDYIYGKDLFKDCSLKEKEIINSLGIISTMFGLRFVQEDPSIVTVELLL